MRFSLSEMFGAVAILAVLFAAGTLFPYITLGFIAVLAIGAAIGGAIAQCRWGMVTGAVFGLSWAFTFGILGGMLVLVASPRAAGQVTLQVLIVLAGTLFGGIGGGLSSREAKSKTPTR